MESGHALLTPNREIFDHVRIIPAKFGKNPASSLGDVL